MPAKRRVLLKNGIVRPMAGATAAASALLIEGDRFAWVGADADAPSSDETIDLGGRCVLPGFTDAHAHVVSFAVGLSRIDLRTYGTLEEAMVEVGRRAATAKAGEWVLGRGWVFRGWGLPGFPHRAQIDRVAAGVPVVLTSMDGHVLWANSAALKAGGVDRNTPDPAGGEFERDASGEPTGILKERAGDAFKERIPPVDPDRMAEALADGQRVLHGFGITSVHDPEKGRALRGLQRFRAAGRLKLRVRWFIDESELPGAALAGFEGGFGDDLLRLDGVKVYADGAVLAETAHMLEPYGQKNSPGIPVTDRATLEGVIAAAAEHRLPVIVHAIGTAANRMVLDAVEAAGRPLPRPYRIEHAQHLHPDDLHRFARLGVAASIQPIHMSYDIDAIERALGDRASTSYRLRSLIDSGARVIFGSDVPVADPNPWLGVHAAVNRVRFDGSPAGGWFPAERISVAEALSAYTAWAAEACGDLAERGTIEAGKIADLCVTDRDPLSIPVGELKDVTVEMTFFGGEIVHAR